MNFQGKAVLVYLEEDNIARAYFRVQPLMTQDGPLGPVVSDFPDDGFLRIVPDKNEQHTFKERMRTLIGLCLVDLRFFPTDANKIRTNKNYAPIRGETNQFIVYSDAVRDLPEQLLYQVVAESDVKNAVTPLVYIRNGANIQGPFRREDGQSAGDIVQLPPDSSEIHSVTVNGQNLLIYWPRAAEAVPEKTEKAEKPEKAIAPVPESAPAPAVEAAVETAAEPAPIPEENPKPQQNAYEQIQSLNEQLSEHANRLYTPTMTAPEDFIPEQPAKPLTGTKLYQTPQRQTSPRRAHNPLMEAVENQRYAARFDTRYETRYEAPGATIPQNTELKEVANPIDALKRALHGMSQSPEVQRQAADVILSQSGMRVMLSRALGREANDLTIAAMHNQLQELEAERLMTLMQLDDAKKNLEKTHEDALLKLNMAEQKKLDQLHIAQQTAQNALDQLNKSIDPIEKKRQEAAEYLDALRGSMNDQPHFLCPPVGGTATRQELIESVEKCLKAAGFQVQDGDALAMLTAYALSDKAEDWCFVSEAMDDAEYALRAFAAALGAPVVFFRKRDKAVVIPGGNAPVFISSYYHKVNHPLVTITACDRIGHGAQEACSWTSPHCEVPVYADPEAIPQTLPECSPVSKECVLKEMLKESPLSQETKAVLSSVRKAVAEAGYPLPLAAVDMMARFIAATQNEFKGGVAEAIDRACCLLVAPHILDYSLDMETLKPSFASMPRTLKALKA